MFEYLLDKIKNSTIVKDPYDHIYIENFLSFDHYDTLIDNFHEKDWISNIAYNRIEYVTKEQDEDSVRDHCYNDECDWEEYKDFLESDIFIKTLCDKFECKNIKENLNYVVHEYLLDFPEHYIPIHEDSDYSEHPVFQISVFLPDEDYEEFGTILYKDEDGSGAVELPMKRNSALIYGLNPKTAWHGTKPGKRIRKSLLTRYRTTNYR